MNKKILYILLLLPLMSFGQYNFFGTHSNNQIWYLYQVAPQYMATEMNFDISFNSDGTSMYVLGGDYSAHIYQYSLNPAWSVRSYPYYSSYSVINEETTPHAMFFKPDGTKLYVLGTNTDKIFQYTLSTAWLISSATYDEKYFYVGGSENIPTALFFKPDGSKVFFLGQQNKTVYVLSLLTNWDISTVNLEAETYDFSSEEIYPHSLWFHDDGLIMYIQGIRKDKIYKYLLSTAWTLPDPWNGATVTLIDSFQINKDEAQGIYINPDELKLYTVGVGNVNTYYFNEPFSISDKGGYPVMAISEATAGGNIFVSDDLGESWTEIDIGWTNQSPISISIGRDIKNIVVTGNTGSSTSSFAFWSNVDGTDKELVSTALIKTYWASAHCSLDGEHFYWGRGHATKYILYSIDAGDNYTSYNGAYIPGCLSSIASSSNNNIIYMGSFASNYSVKKFTSGIGGSSSDIVIWSGVYHPGVACSSDGQRVYVTKGTGTDFIIARSIDGLSNTTQETLATGVTSTYHRYVSCSGDGKYVLATSYPGRTFVSDDYGDTWTEVLTGESYNEYHLFSNGAVSYSGKYMIMGEGTTTKQFYLSADYGETWGTESAPASFESTTVKGVAIQD